MAEPHPLELRDRVVVAYESGEGGYGTVAGSFDVSISSVRRWVAQSRSEGHLLPRRKAGGTRSDISLQELEEIVERLGDANAGEITAAYNRNRRGKKRRHVSSIKRALKRAGFVVKKNESGLRSSFEKTS